MTAFHPQFAALLQQHRAAYLQTLPGRLAQLDTLAGQLAHPHPGEPAPWAALERCAHSLAGSAGTFGLHSLGAAARALELALEGQPPAAATVRAPLATLRQELVALVAPAAAEVQP